MVVSRKQAIFWTLLLTGLLVFTFLRQTLILVYPVILAVLGYLLRLKLNRSILLFTLLFFLLGLLSAYLAGGYFLNFFVSAYLILPIWVFLQARPIAWKSGRVFSVFDTFLAIASRVLVVVNVSAFIYAQFIIDPSLMNYDDAFTGLYGLDGLGSHTLSVINLGFSVYYLSKRKYYSFAFFLISGVFGFYGLGLVIFLISLLLLYATRLLRYWKIMGAILLSSIIAVGMIGVFNPRNLDYIEANINRALLVFDSYDYQEEVERSRQLEVTQIPRFITFLDGSQKRFLGDMKVFMLGAAPGGYNSRTAFYLNGDFVQNEWLRSNFSIRTPAHSEDVYPLLNRELLSKPYNDGTRNQTFSSLVALLLEYGLLAGGGYLIFFFIRIWQIQGNLISRERAEFLKFIGIYAFFLLSVQNYLEYPEIIVPIILLFKLAEFDRAQQMHVD
ncbi:MULTISPECIES: hypothetical protein [Robiginitalea]|uniref:Uncharacterized protein n=1 Tax=Robiginitalea biformata (strain ATCC BAA-864 / DSM 15991 / KCTC 12146 / HTCC2501) TaxID=313596 RepID=A4CI07_ROBBH|nr:MULTISPECIES: hypothetical protein [Robiginitalea]EAR16565.1 hypothetical protein RB2501_06685 [Robiginitalea biformata HTCC2501]MDC6353199.1 hypothetical protein [Robiginitalea sp. PM2]MDC6373634.1 hypothetical protein [Robiginitalea sp. SP8]